jgi:hypothetical protein
VNVECKDTQTSVWRSQYNINVAIKLSEAYTNKMRIIARGLKRRNPNSNNTAPSIGTIVGAGAKYNDWIIQVITTHEKIRN